MVPDTASIPAGGAAHRRWLPNPAAPGRTVPATTALQTPDAAGASLWRSAEAFEAMAIGQFLAPMFDTIDPTQDAFGGGAAEAAWRPMLVDAIGKQIAAHGGLGLAAPVHAALLRAQEGGRP